MSYITAVVGYEQRQELPEDGPLLTTILGNNHVYVATERGFRANFGQCRDGTRASCVGIRMVWWDHASRLLGLQIITCLHS
jgi:hypothetical protein